MKRTTLFLLSLVFVMSSCSIFQGGGKKEFKGEITYKITYPDQDLEPAIKAQLPTQAKMYVMGNYAKVVRSMGMIDIVQVIDGEAKTVTMMIAGSGQKKYITLTEEQINAQNAEIEISGVEKTDETKEIAGYTAHKVVGSYENEYGETTENVYWVAPEIGNEALNFSDPMLKGIDGVSLEYTEKLGEYTMKLTASEIKETKLKETDFLVPDDYEKFTEEEMEQMGL